MLALAGGIARAADASARATSTTPDAETAPAAVIGTADGGTDGAAAAPVTEPPPAKDVPPLVKQVFEQPFPFCKNAKYPLTTEEHKWCALLSKDDTRCPELAKACGLGATAKFEGTKEARTRDARPWQVPVSPLGIRIILWALLAAGVGFIIYQIVQHAIAQGPTDRDRPRDEPEAVVDHAAAAAARQIETDVERLLASARAAAAAGDFRRAIDDAYAALLRKLEGNGVVRVEPHQTNGDHVRDVGRKLPAMRPRMQAVVETVEGVQFGGEPPEETRYRSVLTGVLSLLGERIAGVLPLLITIATLGLLAGGCGLDRDQWDRSPSGRAGVVDLLARYGFDARERLLPLTKVDATVAELVILPAATVEQDDWVALGDWAAQGGTLIIAGGERDLPDWIGVKVVEDKAAPATTSKHAAPPPMSSLALAPDRLEVPEEQGNRLPRLAASVPSGHQVIVAASAMSEPDEVAPAADPGARQVGLRAGALVRRRRRRHRARRRSPVHQRVAAGRRQRAPDGGAGAHGRPARRHRRRADRPGVDQPADQRAARPAGARAAAAVAAGAAVLRLQGRALRAARRSRGVAAARVLRARARHRAAIRARARGAPRARASTAATRWSACASGCASPAARGWAPSPRRSRRAAAGRWAT